MLKRSVSLFVVVLVALLSVSVAQAGISYGPVPGSSPDSGTCGNDWANDSFSRLFTDITPTNFVQWFKNGTFTTVAGSSPAACQGHPDNGNKVVAGILGKMEGSFDVKVNNASQFTPGACTPALCDTTAGFVKTVYGASATYESGATYFEFKYKVCDGRSWHNASANRGGNYGEIAGGLPACKDEVAPKWFDPGDSRVEPKPGDRLAVWCNVNANPPNVVVYGVAGDQPDWNKGFWLATFVNADLLKAGPSGITKNAVEGIVSMMQDGKGHFYVAWNGGKYGATGQGIWSKSFTCNFPASKQ